MEGWWVLQARAPGWAGGVRAAACIQQLSLLGRLFRGALLLLRVGRREVLQEAVPFAQLVALVLLHGEALLRLRQQHEHTEPVPTLAPSPAAR